MLEFRCFGTKDSPFVSKGSKETVTNHVMYADDICLMAPSAIALQKMLNLCYDFSQSNDVILNPIKSQCMVFKPNRFKLCCPAVCLNGNIIEYAEKTKYLGYMFLMTDKTM